MSKGPRIKNWVKWHVREEALRNPTEPREAVAQRIEEYLSGKEPAPTREYLCKMISEARNREGPEDRPWSVASLPNFPISPDALPYVLSVWGHAKTEGRPLTIREALWAGRLYRALESTHRNDLPALLCDFARRLAWRERAMANYPASLEDMLHLWLADAELHDMMHYPGPHGHMLTPISQEFRSTHRGGTNERQRDCTGE